MSTTRQAQAFNDRRAPRIFCIGRNYADHIAELGNNMAGEQAVAFMKPLSALVAPDEPIRLPANRGSVHYEAELVVEIAGPAVAIDAGEARACIGALGLGLDLTLRDVQTALKSSGEPWERAKSFEASAPLGPMTPISDDVDLASIEFELDIDGERRQHGRTRHMLMGVADLVANLSVDWHLAAGDLIFTGTPAGVGPLAAGMRLTLSSPQLATASFTVA